MSATLVARATYPVHENVHWYDRARGRESEVHLKGRRAEFFWYVIEFCFSEAVSKEHTEPTGLSRLHQITSSGLRNTYVSSCENASEPRTVRQIRCLVALCGRKVEFSTYFPHLGIRGSSAASCPPPLSHAQLTQYTSTSIGTIARGAASRRCITKAAARNSFG